MAEVAHGRVLQLTKQTTTSASFGDISGASIASGNFVAGNKYLLMVTALLDTADVNTGIEVQLVHGSTAFPGSSHREEADTTSSKILYCWGTIWTAVSLEDVKLQFRNEDAVTVVGADNIHMTYISLANFTENVDYFFNENTTSTTLTSTPSSSNNASITFTPAVANHKWAVWSFARHDLVSTTISYQSDLLRTGEASETVSSVIKEPENASHNYILPGMGVFQLGNASNTFTEKSNVTTTGTTEARTYSSVIALNLSKFRNAEINRTAAKIDLSATDFATEVAGLTITPDVTGDVWAMGYWVNDLGQSQWGKTRLQIDETDDPTGQTADAFAIEEMHDARDQAPMIVQTLSSQTNAAQVYDLDGSAETAAAGQGALYRSLFAVTMELPAAGATRLYFTSNAVDVAPTSPAVDAAWERSVASFVRRKLVQSKRYGSPVEHASLFGATSTSQTAWAQFHSPPLDGAQTISGTFSMVLQCGEDNLAEDAHLAFVLRVIAPGGTVRGTLASVLTTSTEFPDDSAGGSAETRIHSAVSLTSVGASDGDYIVLDLGVHGETPANANTISLFYGGGAELTDYTLEAGNTSAGAPWVEFSQAIAFDAEVITGTGAPSASQVYDATGAARETFIGSGAVDAVLTPSADGTASNTSGDSVVGSGSPTASQPATAVGVAVNAQDITGSGSPTASQGKTAVGLARETFRGSGNPVASQAADATGTATYVFPGEDPPPAPRAKGGGTRRFIFNDVTPEEKPKPKKKPKPRPVPDADDTEAPDSPLPVLGPVTIDPMLMAQLRAATPIFLPPAPSQEPEYPPIGDPDVALLQHFIAMMGMPDLDDEDMPVMLRRFLRMAQGG